MSTSTAKSETTFIEVAGKKTQVTRGGQGPPLLYLHSAGGETEWMRLHKRLAEHFTVYAPAHPGFALSAGLEEIKDIADLAWHYVDLMAELGLNGVPVVGFSLGGWIATELAILRPQLISRLVLIASAGVRVEGVHVPELFIDDLNRLKELVFYDPKSSVVNEVIPSSLDDPRILMWLRAREATARVAWNPYLHNPRLPQHLRRIESPTRLIWGRHDRLLPLPLGEYFAENIPDAELIVLEECGHMVPFEKCPELAQHVIDFCST